MKQAVRRGITFLQDYMATNAGGVDATHVNMLAQLLIEKGRYGDALGVLDRAPPADGDVPFPDISTKLGVCFVNLGRMDEGVVALRQLLHESAPAYHDLFITVRALANAARMAYVRRSRRYSSVRTGPTSAYTLLVGQFLRDAGTKRSRRLARLREHMRGVQALTTLAQADAVEQAVPLVQHCAASFESEFTLAANAAATAAGALGPPAPLPAPGAAEAEQEGEPLASAEELADRLAELLPSLLACARAPGAAELVCSAHALAYAHLPRDHTEFVTVALEYVSQLSLRAQPGDAERVESVLREMDDANAAAPVEAQVRRAEAWLHAGDNKAFAESMGAIIESQTYMAAETDDILVRHVHAFHLHTHKIRRCQY